MVPRFRHQPTDLVFALVPSGHLEMGLTTADERELASFIPLEGKAARLASGGDRPPVRPRPPKRRVLPAGVGVRLTKSGTGTSRWTPWSVRLWRVFEVNALAYPTCG